MAIDVVYLTHNRLEFTRESWAALVANTDWSLVRRLVVYDDSSTDGTAEWIRDAVDDAPVACSFVSHGLGSPVAVMQSYLHDYDGDLFAKIDSDIVVPPGWLDAMVAVLAAHPELELLGMEAGRNGLGADARRDREGYDYEPCTHIGGVGVLRTSAFRGRSRRLLANGRFGFTEWQHATDAVRGWIRPDLPIFGLDLLPFDPWLRYSKKYVAEGWQRKWPTYDDKWSSGYYDWWTAGAPGRRIRPSRRAA